MGNMDVIMKKLDRGNILKTPSGRADFRIDEITMDGITVVVGQGEWSIFIPADCWEKITSFIGDGGPVYIGAKHGSPIEETLDWFIQDYTKGVSAASYVAPILEKVGIAKIDRNEPARISLK